MTIDTRTKGTLTLLLCVSAFTLPWTVGALLLLSTFLLPLLSSAFRPISDRSRRAFRRFSLYAAVLAGVLILLNSILLREGTALFTFLGIPLFDGGFLFGVKTATRLLLLSFSLLHFFLSTPIRIIASELQQTRIPPQIILSLLLALHFIDRLPARIERIFAAQEARGAPIRSSFFRRVKSFFTILTPLILTSISESIDRGIALELRGFHSGVRLLDAPPSTRSSVILSRAFLTLSLLLILWRIIRWVLL
ncbi:MAG TPA: energy-coupling factor transporter transmembrane component T [Bacteroidota bacterium]|nr:energy-coupling factor transporter transmembrane component T [Bacteroidota bacterium]